jgi:FkbM family methyltransferase
MALDPDPLRLSVLVPFAPRLARAIPILAIRRPLLRALNALLKRRPIAFMAQTPLGFRIVGNTRDVIQRHIYVFGVWEPDITAWIRDRLSPGATVVDVGANIGYFTLLAAAAVGPGGKVHAVEPLPSTVDVLKRNIALNEFANVTVHPVACSDKEGTIEIFSGDAGNLGNSSTLGGQRSEGLVPCVSLDRLLDGSDAPTLLKIDTEGDEARVLSGAKNTLRRMAPGSCVLVEVTPRMLDERGMGAHGIFDMMREFDAYAIPNDYHPARYADRAVSPPERIADVPAIAQDVVFVKR